MDADRSPLTKRIRPKDVRVAPNIWQTPHGWRVYVRRDGELRPVRFKRETPFAEVQAFVDGFKRESAQLRAQRLEARGTFAGDAAKYLELKVVRAMPSYEDRARDIRLWVKAFGRRPRGTITPREIDEQLQAWLDAGKAASTVNNRRAALMSLFTRLDGRSAANPVKSTRVYEEPAPTARGLSYALVEALLEAMPAHRSRPVKGVKGSRSQGNKTRARLALMAWTGLTPAQIKQLKPRHVNLRERWYISPRRGKGARRPRHPRPEIRKPMSSQAAAAFRRFIELNAWGDFDSRALRHALERARLKVQRGVKTSKGRENLIAKVRPYDFRHTFGTELYRQTGNLELVAQMLDHSSLAMTRRYALGAVPDVLRAGVRAFERGTAMRKQR